MGGKSRFTEGGSRGTPGKRNLDAKIRGRCWKHSTSQMQAEMHRGGRGLVHRGTDRSTLFTQLCKERFLLEILGRNKKPFPSLDAILSSSKIM